MATTLHLRDTFSLTTATGSTLKTCRADTVASGTEIQFRDFQGTGDPAEWVSAPLQAVTIAGTITVQIQAYEDVMTANIGGHAKIYRRRGGSDTLIGSGSDGVEFATSNTAMSWTITPTSTALIDGDMLVVKMYIVNQGTMGGSAFGYLHVGSTGTSDSYVTFTETLTNLVISAGTGSNTVAAFTSAGTGDVAFDGPVGTGSNTTAAITSAGAGEVSGRTGVGANTVADFYGSGLGSLHTPQLLETITSVAYGVRLLPSGTTDTIFTASGGGVYTTLIPSDTEFIYNLTYSPGSSTDSVQLYSTTTFYIVNFTTKHKLAFSTNSFSSASFGSRAETLGNGWNNTGGKGYFVGGVTNSSSDISSHEHSTETYTATAASIATSKYLASTVQSGTHGYEVAGDSALDTNSTVTEKMSFSTETVATVSAVSGPHDGQSGVSSSTIGYMAHSGTGGMYKYVFSSETASHGSSGISGNLHDRGSAAVGGSGYMIGYAYRLKINFSTDALSQTVTTYTTQISLANTPSAVWASMGATRTGTGANTATLSGSASGIVGSAGTGSNTVAAFTSAGTGTVASVLDVTGIFQAQTLDAIAVDCTGVRVFNATGSNTLGDFTTRGTGIKLVGGFDNGTSFVINTPAPFDTVSAYNLNACVSATFFTTLSPVSDSSGGWNSQTHGYYFNLTRWGGTESQDYLGKRFSFSTGAVSNATTWTNQSYLDPDLYFPESSWSESDTHGYSAEVYNSDPMTLSDKYAFATDTSVALSASLGDSRYASPCSSDAAAFFLANGDGGKNKIVFSTDTVAGVAIGGYGYFSQSSVARPQNKSSFVAIAASGDGDTNLNTFDAATESSSYGSIGYAGTYLQSGTSALSAKAFGVFFANDVPAVDAHRFDYSSQTLTPTAIATGTAYTTGRTYSYFPSSVAIGIGFAILDDFVTNSYPPMLWDVRLDNFTSEASGSKLESPGVGFYLGSWTYFAGAYTTSYVWRSLFAVGTFSLSAASMPSSKGDAAGVSAQEYGYSCGGSYIGAGVTNIQRISYATTITGALGATLTTARRTAGGVHSLVKGYVAGGYYSGLNYDTSVDVLDFSNETVSALSAAMAEGRFGTVGVVAASKAFLCGGVTEQGGSSVNTDIVERLTFSTETLFALSVYLVAPKQNGAGMNSETTGYIGNGDPNYFASDKLAFSTETLSSNSVLCGGFGTEGISSYDHGYFAGGGYPGIGSLGDGWGKFNFASDTSLTSGSLGIGTTGQAGVYKRTKFFLGTGAVTLANFTQSASGSLDGRFGQGANTAELSSAGAGEVFSAPISGTGSAVVSTTSAGTGELIDGRTGTGSSAASVESSGAGSLIVSGQANTGASMSSSGTGTVSITGMGDAEFISFMQSALGTVSVTGAFTPTTLGDAFVSDSFGYVTDYAPADPEARLASIDAQHAVVEVHVTNTNDEIVVN